MIWSRCLLAVGVCLLGARSLLAAPSPEFIRALERRWESLQKPAAKLEVREVVGFALEASAAEWHPERAERALELVNQMQDRDPKSKTYGNFKWSWGDEAPADLNAVEFTMQQAVLLRMRYSERLTPKARDLLNQTIRLAEQGVRSHKVDVSYTNIFLMKSWNLIAIGEITNQEATAKEGYQALDQWVAYTAENGVHEYLSSTYYGVDLESLGLIARLAKRAEGRRQAERALHLFWTDIAANWFEPGQRLGGAHSRTYDYLTGHGALDRPLARVGWIKGHAEPFPALAQACAWEPPAALHEKLALGGPHLVQQRWGPNPDQTATHYVGQHVSVGSAGSCYHNMDQVLTVNVAGGPTMPMISFMMDGRGDPYGHAKITDRGGHAKAFHLVPFVASVQKGPEVLLLAANTYGAKNSGVKDDELTCLQSHLILPTEGELWVGAAKLAPATDGKPRPIAEGETVVLRCNDVAVALRFVLGRDTAGRPAQVVLVEDGGEFHVRRLTCIHSADKPKGKATVAVWVRAAEGLDEAGFQAFRKACGEARSETAVEGDVVGVEIAGLAGKLRLRADVAHGKTMAREGGEPTIDRLILAIDGKEVGRTLLTGDPPSAP